MYRYYAIFSVVTACYYAQLQTDQVAIILQYEYNTDGKGNYNYSFTTSNGITKSETGTVIDEGLPDQFILVKGMYSYTTPDGKKQEWFYTADKNGFHQEHVLELFKIGVTFALPSTVVASLLGK